MKKQTELLGRAFGRTSSSEEAIEKLLASGYRELESNDTKARVFIKSEKTEEELYLFNEILNRYKSMERTGRRVDDAINAAIAIVADRIESSKSMYDHYVKGMRDLVKESRAIATLLYNIKDDGDNPEEIERHFVHLLKNLEELTDLT